jgi:hypothetical protein
MRSLALLSLLLPGVLGAQTLGLPLYHQVNPMVESRTGLYFQPYLDPHPGWSAALGLDYSSMVELNFRGVITDTAYILDAETSRLNLQVRRDLTPRDFLLAEAFLGGAYPGFMDGFLNWYHHLFGFSYPERDMRPKNSFDYALDLPTGTLTHRQRTGGYLGDVRLGLGHRFNPNLQTVLTLTLPTSTAPVGYGRGTISAGLINTYRASLDRRWSYEGALGLGVTPSHGDLSGYQNHAFVMVTSGLRYRFWGRLSAFTNLFYHSPYYHDTGLPALDGNDLTLDYGFVLRTRSGREWRAGMTEDLSPRGPAIDLSFRFSTAW